MDDDGTAFMALFDFSEGQYLRMELIIFYSLHSSVKWMLWLTRVKLLVWRVTLEWSRARAGHPPWCFGSEDCHAPAGKTAGPFQADWPHSSSRWQKVLGPQTPGTWTGPHLPPPGSGWTGLAWWWVGAGPSGLKMKMKVFFKKNALVQCNLYGVTRTEKL